MLIQEINLEWNVYSDNGEVSDARAIIDFDPARFAEFKHWLGLKNLTLEHDKIAVIKLFIQYLQETGEI